MNKREMLRGKETKLDQRGNGDPQEEARLRRGVETVQATFTLKKTDVQFLNEAAREYTERSPRRISKSELVRVGIHLLKDNLQRILSEIEEE